MTDTNKREIVCSGIRPTGNLHLGNYFGALRNFVKMQDEYDCFFFVADYHSLTTHPTPDNLYQNARQILVQYLAAGLDPERSTIYFQSDLPQTVELYLFFNMNAYLGELERVTSFKDKVRQNPNNVNAGLLTYPTLMAADILIHKATRVPVGKDQEQHLEMTRTYAQRFNSMYGSEVFPLPQAVGSSGNLVKIPALNGSGKMGKSEGEASTIFLTDEPSVIRKKIMKAKSDSGPTEMNQKKPEEIENLFSLLKAVSKPETVEYFDDLYNRCQIRYGDLKKQLAEDMVAFVEPLRQRILEVGSDEEGLRRIIDRGKEKARASADRTIHEVRHVIGGPVMSIPFRGEPAAPAPVEESHAAASYTPPVPPASVQAVPVAQPRSLYQDRRDSRGKEIDEFFEEMTDEELRYSDCVEVWAADAKPAAIRLLKLVEALPDKKTADALGREAEYINAMLDRIYYFTMLDSIRDNLELKEYNFSAVVKDCLRRFSPFFMEKRIGLLWKGLDINIVTDKRWLIFALTQVVFNAVEFTGLGGKIAISAKKEGSLIHLMVDDNGCGIPEAELPKIFLAGYMGDNVPNESGRRTGMGLFITRSVVEKLGGSVTVESTVGKGTRITMILPEKP